MGVKYSSNLKYLLAFNYLIQGEVQESDIIGSLFAMTSSYNINFGINKLQNIGKIGKLTIQRNESKKDSKVNGNLQTGIITIPIDLDRADVAIFCSIIEMITRVKLFTAKFQLKSIEDTEKANNSLLLNRSLEIYTRYFEDGDVSIDSIKKNIYQLTSSKKISTCETFHIGSTFNESKMVIVVQGRADILALSKANINNTFALGGLDFDTEKVSNYLKNKTLILFRDGDQGGKEIQKKLNSIIDIEYIVETPSKVSVED